MGKKKARLRKAKAKTAAKEARNLLLKQNDTWGSRNNNSGARRDSTRTNEEIIVNSLRDSPFVRNTEGNEIAYKIPGELIYSYLDFRDFEGIATYVPDGLFPRLKIDSSSYIMAQGKDLIEEFERILIGHYQNRY